MGAKLGFSWEALDVKLWQGGLSGLETAVSQLTQTIEISDEVTAQPHDCESLIVQEYIPHDFEYRVYTVEGKVAGNVYTKFCSVKENQEFGDFHQYFEAEQAAKAWMGGDMESFADAARQCNELTEHWLEWLRAQSCELPPAVR